MKGDVLLWGPDAVVTGVTLVLTDPYAWEQETHEDHVILWLPANKEERVGTVVWHHSGVTEHMTRRIR